MKTNLKLIRKYALDSTIFSLDKLDEIAIIENTSNNWDLEKYFGLGVIDKNHWQFNFYGKFKNIVFERVGKSHLFKIQAGCF